MRRGYDGSFGGQYVTEGLLNALEELEREIDLCEDDRCFMDEYEHILKNYAGRETPLYRARNLSEHYGATIYIKREDLNHGGSFHFNNAAGQVFLAKRLGKKQIVTADNAGPHGYACASACALYQLPCTVYMSRNHSLTQDMWAAKMRKTGAKVLYVAEADPSLDRAVDMAFRMWASKPAEIFYVSAFGLGPYPYPRIYEELQKVIGEETKRQALERDNALPDVLVAGLDGSAIGLFSPFKEDLIQRYVAEPDVAPVLERGTTGIYQGMKTLVLQEADGFIAKLSSPLAYPAASPKLADLKENGLLQAVTIKEEDAKKAVEQLARMEGIAASSESGYALALAFFLAEQKEGQRIVVCLTGQAGGEME